MPLATRGCQDVARSAQERSLYRPGRGMYPSNVYCPITGANIRASLMHPMEYRIGSLTRPGDVCKDRQNRP